MYQDYNNLKNDLEAQLKAYQYNTDLFDMKKLNENVEATANLPVYIQTNSGNIPVLCKYGNEVIANMLNKRVNYPIGYGNENPNYTDGQFIILSCCNLNKRGTTE